MKYSKESQFKKITIRPSIKPTLTIGIPALNESANIVRLIEQIRRQEERGFLLKTILIASDGSTDNTVDQVLSIGDTRIQVIRGETRRGKAFRMNEMFANTETDIIVLFDADIDLASDTVVAELLAPMIADSSIALVYGVAEPRSPKNFFQKAVFTGWNIWNDIRMNTPGAELYRYEGPVCAFRKYLYKTVQFPEACGADTIPFLHCAKYGYPISFAPKALVRYSLPGTYKDHYSQTIRFMAAKDVHGQYFDDEFLDRFYVITTSDKVKALISHGVKNPFWVFSYLVIYAIPRVVSMLKPSRSQTALWDIATSTKKK